MNASLFRVAGFTVTPILLIASVAILQWLAFALVSTFSRTRHPKRGLRATERNLLISSAVVAVAWLLQADPSRFASKTRTVKASVVETKQQGSCASVEEGMTAADVKAKVGTPDEVRSEEATRGPSATVFIYRGSRCAVHILDDRVDSVD